MSFFERARKEIAEDRQMPIGEIWLDAVALWCFVTVCVVVVSVGAIVSGVTWLLKLCWHHQRKT